MAASASTTVLGALGLAVLAVVLDPLWRWTGKLETLVHEAGHATMLLVTGNWPTEVVIGSGRRAGGHTGLPDRPIFLPSAVAAASAGYAAPSVAGLVLARSVDRGWSPVTVLAGLLVVLVVLALFHGNWTALLVISTAGSLLALFLWRAAPSVQVGVVVALAWFLLLAGLRSMWEIADVPASKITDFTYLARRTGVPAEIWFLSVGLGAMFSLFVGAGWLLTH